MNVAKK